MAPRRLGRTAGLALSLTVLAILAGLGVLAYAFLAPTPGDSKRTVAAPPGRALTNADKIIARLINAADHDMRSVELGRWFVRQVRSASAAIAPGDCTPEAFPLAAIADRVPGANAVTKAELANHLADLVREACAVAGARGDIAATLLDFEIGALGPADGQTAKPDQAAGLLLGMPGYALTSPVPLPA